MMKTDFRIKCFLRVIPVQVKHFKVSGKAIRHFMTPHNKVGFNSKVSEDMATEIPKNRWF